MQLIADQFAANGYLAYVPDIFQGDPVPLNRPEGYDLRAWLSGKLTGQAHGPEQVEPVTGALVKHMRAAGCRKVGGIGYCFGAKYVVRHMGMHGDIDAGFLAHPTQVEESELEQIKGPLSIAAACMFRLSAAGVSFASAVDRICVDPDAFFPPEKRHKSEEILQRIGVPYQINLYSHIEHGFSVRGDISKKPIKFAKEQAFLQAVQWFDEYLIA